MGPGFIASTEVDLPIADLFELFMDKTQFQRWKKDFLGYEHLAGQPGEVGAVTRLRYKRQDMLETIVAKNAPFELIADYAHQQGGRTNMYHTVTYRSTPLDGSRTRLVMETRITRTVGLMMTIMMRLMVGLGRKHAQLQLDRLKALAGSKR